MSRDSDPRHIDEEGPSELGRLVRSARSARGGGPSEAAVGRMTKKLAAAGVLGATSKSAIASDGLLRIFGKFAYYKVAALAIVVVGGSTMTVRTVTRPAASVTSPVAAAAAAPAVTSHTTPSPDSQPSAPTPRESESVANTELAAIPVDALPSSASPPARPIAPPNKSTSTNTAVSPSAEFALIHRAQGALASDPNKALALVDEHARAYPSGELAQEREVVAVEALSRLGRKAEATQRANALLRRFPRTPYVVRLESAIGERLSP